MDTLELILFDVGHGLSVALIEKPENYVTLVDLGAENKNSYIFSPLIYLYEIKKLYPDILFITHPHGDHITDVSNALNLKEPISSINYQDYDWNEVESMEKPELRQRVRSYRNLISNIPQGSYNGNAELYTWAWSPEKAKNRFGETNFINNSSIFIIYQWRDFKISIAGDHHTDAMEALIKHEEFKKQAQGTYILVAPHHGHSEGFTSLWPNVVGKPFVNLISVQSKDPHVAAGYSDKFSQGVAINGKTKYTLTTRKYGHICVDMSYEQNKPVWDFSFAKI